MKYLRNPFVRLLIILVVALILRSYQLGNVPQSLNWDEVALGYNAYSIFTTGKDEYGDFLPLVLRSFDDYKPALYTYLVVPMVALLDLTEQAVRLPSVIAGVLAVALVYFLVKEIIQKQKINILGYTVSAELVALLSSFFLAISPWHIQFSRIAYESNVGLTVNILIFLLFLKALKRPMLLPIPFMLAALNIHVYQSDRVFSPLLVTVLSVIFLKKLLRVKGWVIVSVILAFVVALPFLIYVLTNNDALLRAKGVSVYSQVSLVERSSEKLLIDNKSNNHIGKVFDNRRVEYVKSTIEGYISHFDLNWLFVTGDLPRHHAPSMGLLYLFQLPLLLLGVYILVFLNIDKLYKISFVSYFLLVPVPASVTSGVPHAVRTLNFVWTWEFIISLGMIGLIVIVFNQKRKLKSYCLKICFALFVMVAILNLFYFLNQYFVQQNYFYARDWLFGYKQAIQYIEPISKNYDRVVVENEVPFDQSYMFFLFYLKVDPSYYQSLGGTASGGFKEKHKGFYNYTFEPIDKHNVKGNILIVGGEEVLARNANVLKKILLPDGSPVIYIAEENEK